MKKVLVAMGYEDDGWKSSQIHARELHKNLASLRPDYGLELYLPTLGRKPRFIDRRFRYGAHIGDIDVFHLVDPAYGDFLTQLSPQVKKIVTVTDCAFWLNRTFINSPIRKLIVNGVKAADCVIAISEKTRRELKDVLGVEANRVIYLGVDEQVFKLSQVHRNPKQILHIGSNQPRKRIDRIIRLLKFLPDDFLFHQIGTHFNSEQVKMIKDFGLENRVSQIETGSLSQIIEAYQSCGVFVFPSDYEGYGMPCIESRLTGASLVVSNDMPALESLPNDGGFLGVDFRLFDSLKAHPDKDKVVNWIIENSGKQIPLENRESYSWLRAAKEVDEIYRGYLG